MNRHVYAHPIGAINRIKTAIVSHIKILAPDQSPHSSIFVSLLQVHSILGFFVFEIDHVISGSSPVLAAGQVLVLHLLDFVILSYVLIIHELPPLKVPLIFLNPIHFLLTFYFTYLFCSTSCFLNEFYWSLLSFSCCAKSLEYLSLSRKGSFSL